MRKRALVLCMALTTSMLVGCGNNDSKQEAGDATKAPVSSTETFKATAFGQGFDAHKDVVYATAEVDSQGNLVNLDINEYLGIRSVGRIINNITKADEEQLAKVAGVADENKVLSEDGQYANYKYVMIDGRYFECKDAGENLYVEIGKDASIQNLMDYMWENQEWWYNAMQKASENGAILKVAEDKDDVLVEIDGVKLAKLEDLTTFYGGLTKKDGYSKNFSQAQTTTAWAESIEKLTSYIVENKGVSDQLYKAANADTTKEYLDTVSGATFGYPSLYVNIAKQAIDEAVAKSK